MAHRHVVSVALSVCMNGPSCLTLEYGVSSAAMARIWGEKLVTWLDHMGYRLWDPRGNTINIYAGVREACIGRSPYIDSKSICRYYT